MAASVVRGEGSGAPRWRLTVTGYALAGKSLEEIAAVCESSGFAGIEGMPMLAPEADGDALEQMGREFVRAGFLLETYHLPFTSTEDVAAFYETDRRKAVANIKRSVERAARLGARIGILHPTTNRHSTEVEGVDAYLRTIGRSLEELLPFAAEHNFTIAVENMLPNATDGARGRFGSTIEHLSRLFAEFGHPNLGFCLDTGHALVSEGLDGPERFVEALGEYLVTFHLQDNAGDRDSHLAPGRGLVNWDALFQAVARAGYEGSMCVESGPFAPGPEFREDAWRGLYRGTVALIERAVGGESVSGGSAG